MVPSRIPAYGSSPVKQSIDCDRILDRELHKLWMARTASRDFQCWNIPRPVREGLSASWCWFANDKHRRGFIASALAGGVTVGAVHRRPWAASRSRIDYSGAYV